MYAIVSLLFGNDKYVPGALVLGKILKKFLKIKIDCILMITPDISNKSIKKLEKFWIIKKVKYLNFPNVISKRIPPHRKYYSKVFTKFHLFTLTKYSKVLFMDLSYIPLSKKILNIFNYKTPAMMFVPQFLTKKNKKRLKSGKIIPKDLSKYVNAALMLFTPNIDEFNKLIFILKKYKSPKLKFPEQEFLGNHYSGKIFFINPQYYCNKHTPKCTKSCLGIKYLSSVKPWDTKKKERNQCEKIWFDFYKNILKN